MVRLYLDHTGEGLSIRALARREGAHASTIMRKVRRCEMLREDPLVDEALAQAGEGAVPALAKDPEPMTAAFPPASLQLASARPPALRIDDATLAQEAQRILRRLAEPGCVLAVATDLEKAVVLRSGADGSNARLAVVDRNVAQAFALKDWITCRKSGRVASYEITHAGRAALRRMLEDADEPPRGLAESATPFADQHRSFTTRVVEEEGQSRRIRVNMAESPVAVLGRRRDRDGKPFLSPDLVRAAERLREDFEIAQMGPRVAQNWDRFLTGGARGQFRPDGGSGGGEGHARARDRVAAALRDLGPGLGDVALRVCCFLEGIEAAEQRMGWAARSGKVVLRIALQRLHRHYEETYGDSRNMIG
ncbi:MAG: helix-turn-helix domain-containing protein [Cypionkella sp.]|nr:helix-turn-helix domain-containing protein [Cypionkella sp.]